MAHAVEKNRPPVEVRKVLATFQGAYENLLTKQEDFARLIESYYVRSLFVEMGRGDWNEMSGNGNPTEHHTVKQYLVQIHEEQAKARITPKQAVPLFFDGLFHLCSFLQDQVFLPSFLLKSVTSMPEILLPAA